MPAPPIPAITRPITKAFELGAAPHSALPASNVIIEDTMSHLISKVL